MTIENVRRIIGAILLISLIGIGFLKPVQAYINIPKELVLFENEVVDVSASLPLDAQEKRKEHKEVISVVNSDQRAISVEGIAKGLSDMTLELGGFPVKNVNVEVLPDFKVIPGGQSIGVKLHTEGVLVVGHHLIETEKGNVSPGEEAGVMVGDIITKINNEPVQKMSDIAPFVQEAGKKGEELQLEIKRDDEVFNTTLLPLQDKNEKKYKMGIYVRDSAAGIGTMTFYDPQSKRYGALGHVISDMDTKKPIVVHDGQIVQSTVTSIEKGSNGNPGEKLAQFSEEHDVIGNITKNSPFGIFGKLNKDVDNGIMNKPIPIALSHQVKEGPAKILTVIEGTKVRKFDVEIVSSVPQKFPATKGMVIKITDPELLNATGGIVQGMSGSPIIQDGKLIGAVTHVFVNDPTSGYGCHIEWMLNDAGINIYKENKEQERKAS